MTSPRLRHLSIPALLAALAWALAGGSVARAADPADDDNTEPRSGEYRVTLFPYHKLTAALTGFGYLGYVNNPDKDYTTDYLGYGFSYMTDPSTQWWLGLVSTYTDNAASADKWELRPFVGLKNFIPNSLKWNIYNYARWEYRSIRDSDTHDWARYSRLRERFGIEFPLASADQAWKPKTWYGLADAEVMYRFDRNQIDPCRLRAGIAYIVNDRVRAEFIYHIQWTRPGGGDLQFTENIFRLNIKIALTRGVLQRVFDGGDSVD